jgi:hypothetical protein
MYVIMYCILIYSLFNFSFYEKDFQRIFYYCIILMSLFKFITQKFSVIHHFY